MREERHHSYEANPHQGIISSNRPTWTPPNVGTTLVSLWRVRPAVLSSQEGPGASAVVADSTDFYQRHENNLHTHNNVEMAEEM